MKQQHQKRFINLPKARVISRVVFEKPVICNLKLALNGIKQEDATQEIKEKNTIPDCIHPLFPPLYPQCTDCLLKNKHEIFLVDKKGRQSRVIK